jgi:Na+/glutamate symporter
MFILGFGALGLRLFITKDYPLLGLFNTDTIRQSALLLTAPSAVFIFFGIYSGHFNRRLKRLEKLVLPYMLFGGLQQILFFWVFADSVFYLTKNFNLTFMLTIVFFLSVHLNWKSSVRKYWMLLIIFAVINTYIYLVWGNILPQVLIHGLVGSILFTEFTDTDQLKNRTGRG